MIPNIMMDTVIDPHSLMFSIISFVQGKRMSYFNLFYFCTMPASFVCVTDPVMKALSVERESISLSSWPLFSKHIIHTPFTLQSLKIAVLNSHPVLYQYQPGSES